MKEHLAGKRLYQLCSRRKNKLVLDLIHHGTAHVLLS
jgi:hypothetical protein